MSQQSGKSITVEGKAESRGESDSPSSRSVYVPADASDPAFSLRRGIAITVGEAPITPVRAARNLLVSFFMLIAIIVAGTVTIRDILNASERPGRSCPLNPCYERVRSVTKSKSSRNEDCLADSPVDWDRILLSSKFSCVFDPTSLSIGNLLALPPPTFKSKVDFVSAVNYLSRLGSGETRQYITISE